MTPERLDRLVNRESGLLGVSETSADVRDLLAQRESDVQAAEAIDHFCYRIRSGIGAFAAVLGGWTRSTTGGGEPDVVMACCGDVLTLFVDEKRLGGVSAPPSPDGSALPGPFPLFSLYLGVEGRS